MSRVLFLVALLCSMLAWSAASMMNEATAAAAAVAEVAKRPLRDPFVRPAPPPPPPATAPVIAPVEPPPLRLRAVILNGAHSIANIDGDVVGAGDQARDYTVVRIDAHGVLVRRAGKQQLLTINEKDKQ
jgi:hypothetical protein